MMIKTYTELIKRETLIDRFRYLKITDRKVGEDTFGCDRYLNQLFYRLPEWKETRRKIIIRDQGGDLGLANYPIKGTIIVHHMIPITPEDIINRASILFDPEYLISTSFITHNAIHYGDENLLFQDPIERRPNDTCPWKE